MQKSISKEKAIKNAIASVKMEGFKVNPKLEHQCKQIIHGKMDLKECVSQIVGKGI